MRRFFYEGSFLPNGTNYFGLTQNNSRSWIGTSTDRSLYFLIAKGDLVDASWSGKLKIKPDSNDTAYTGPGEYLFKVGRYTSANDSSADWSNELTVRITGPTPTLSPTPKPTDNPTSAPTLTKTPTPTPTRTPVPTKSPSPRPTPTETPEGMVLGEEEVSPSPQAVEKPKAKFPLPAIGLVALGMGLITFSVIRIIKSAKKSYTIESGKENNQIS